MRSVLALFALACAASTAAPPPAPPGLIWLEAEQTASSNRALSPTGWGRSEFLSQQRWVQIQVDADKVAAEVPDEGIQLAYRFTTAPAGRYQVWNRVGYEFVRSPIDWRIDDGPWTTVGPETLTTDLMELQEWNEVAWLQLGEAELTAGEHTLTIRLRPPIKPDGKPDRILYASDLICLYPGRFHPNGPVKPGDDWRTDADRRAAEQVFRLPAAAGPGQRVSVKLAGDWEVCRHDEQLPPEESIAAPIADLPAQPYWRAIAVPGDKNQLRPDLIFCHRLWYRTRFEVPASLAGRGFQVVFPQNNLNTTVMVNGVPCGFEKSPFCKFAIDITRGVKPGVNELWVGLRDAWYGFASNPSDPLKLRRTFNRPVRYFTEGFQDLAYPIWNHAQSGILFAPELVATGPVYTADAFCQPSVREKRLTVDATIANPGGEAASGELRWEAVDDATGRVARPFAPAQFRVPAGGTALVKLTGAWPDPSLWWPDAPALYRLRTTLLLDGRPVDIAEQPFGFREWGADGQHFTLNGLRWHGWADTHTAPTPEAWLLQYRQFNQTMMRFWGMSWHGRSPDQALDWFDRRGVVVRRSGLLDGQRIGYHAMEQDPQLREKWGSEINLKLMRNWEDQVTAQVRGERNHPSVMIWSLENEWLYINCINLHGGHMDAFEAEVTRVSNAVRATDPTRPTMVDGGGATKAQTLPVHGDHYVFSPGDLRYPDLAYQPNLTGGGRGRWEWDQQRPRFLGEDYFATGINPADYAIFGGEATFLGKAQAKPAAGLVYRMLTEGYRWAEYGAWHFWLDQFTASGQYASNAPRAVFCRQWDWSFGSGRKVARTFGIFNDTRFADPITFTWVLSAAGRELGRETTVHRVPPGRSERFERTLALPTVRERTEAELLLKLVVAGKQVFADTKAVSILPTAMPAGGLRPAAAGGVGVLLFDPSGTLAPFLRGQVAVTPVASLDALPDAGRVLLIGPGALSEAESTSSRLAAWASAGRRVIVLEQRFPLKYQAAPADLEATGHDGRIAFAEDLSHPSLRGLQQKDFFTWGGDQIIYRNAYRKPTRGARSLVQCGARLLDSALLEVPVGQGLMLLCQLAVGEKLDTTPVAQQLLRNLLDRAAAYELRFRAAQAALGDDPLLPGVLEAIGLQYRRAADPLAAIGDPATQLVVVTATPAHLAALAGALPRLEAFYQRGGYLMLCGLTPEGLADYNRIVGVEHMIRPFRMERVTFPTPRHPLSAGLSNGDITMLSGERIFGWTSDEFVEDEVFGYCVDDDEVLPFGEFPSDYFHNMVNGFVSADAWKYIFSFERPGDTPPEFVVKLPREQELVRFEWIGNAFYHLVTRVELSADGGPPRSFDTAPNNEPQTFEIEPPLRGRELRFKLAAWQRVPDKADVVGVDNLRLWAARPADWRQRVQPLVSCGGLMHYPRGQGGIVLCNLKWLPAEAVPINQAKKQTILAAILRNLRAPFSGKTVIAGANLAYQPIDISRSANQYRNERGWFGDQRFTFAALPTGRQTFAGVPFEVFDFPTSPVPTCVMLGGDRVPGNLPDAVPGITVARRADALFLLQAARIDRRRSDREVREDQRFELARYVVTYADGQTAVIPVFSETDIDDYRQQTPRAVPGAQLAWARPYDGTEFSAVAYCQQWNNPRPEVEIRALDLVAPAERRGTLALLALTAASAP